MKKRKTIIVCAAIVVVLLAALGYAVLREPFVRTETVLAEGLSTQTTLYTLDSGKPGKTIFFLAGTHGNEEAGYEAARKMVCLLYTSPSPRD